MIDMDIKAIMSATGIDQETVIECLITHLQNRLRKKGRIKTEYLYLSDFCKYLQQTGTQVNDTDIDHYFETRKI